MLGTIAGATVVAVSGGAGGRIVRIGDREVGTHAEPYIIAEMSGNHDGSLDKALEIVRAAAQAGAHAVKLQTYTADTITIDVDSPDFRLSDDHELWLVVRPVQEQRYVVQGDGPVSIVNGVWQGSVTVGDGTSTANGQRYLIYVIDVDKRGGDILRSERVEAATGGVELPAGAEKAAAVMVELQT